MILQHNRFLHLIEVIQSTGKVDRGCVEGSLHKILLVDVTVDVLIVQGMIRQLNHRFVVKCLGKINIY